VTEDDQQSETPRNRKRAEIGNDGLSKLWRERIESESDHPPPITESIDHLVRHSRAKLVEKGWPDPLLPHVWREGSPTGEVVDDRLIRRIRAGLVEEAVTLPGWQTLRLRLEADGAAFTDDWYCAKLMGLGLEALEGEGEGRARALVNFGYYFRDWQARRSFGRKAKSKVKTEGNVNARKNPAIAQANVDQRNVARLRKAAIREIALDMWAKKPSARASELTPRVSKELERRIRSGELPFEKLPADGTIRNAISKLRPKL
jgi:hypothetical protein